MRTLDLPPLWLAALLFFTWISPWGLPGSGYLFPGLLCLVFAAVLTIAALLEFRRARTTVIPHRVPAALITSGVFRWTRNPIYLADVLILGGLTLIWGRLFGLISVPMLVVLLERRFIRSEEARLKEEFGAEFETYFETTRRWF